MGNNGVYFAGDGKADLLGNDSKMSAAPRDASGRGDPGMKFVNDGGGDQTNVAYGTDSTINLDQTRHDYKSGEGFTPIADNNWTGQKDIPA